MEAINPLPKASVEDKQRKRKYQESEIVSETPYNKLIESKERVSKMKGKAQRQLEGLEEAQEKGKSGVLKLKNCARRKLSLPMPSTSTSSAACARCRHTFEDDRVQCGCCVEWWHEDGSSWEGSGSFLCDSC
jgi:hypothetical protein